MQRKRLVLFVEGDGDVAAAPVLVKKLISARSAWEYLTLDDSPFRVGDVHALTGRLAPAWIRFLRAALKRPKVGAVLLLLDGDARCPTGEKFCAADRARSLAAQAREAGAGRTFSVACVFARQEFESWFLAGIGSLRGKSLPDGRAGIRTGAPPIAGDTDEAPRDAKKWLAQHMAGGYKASVDQAVLAQMLDVSEARANSRSLRRLETALGELCEALRTGVHRVSPAE